MLRGRVDGSQGGGGGEGEERREEGGGGGDGVHGEGEDDEFGPG